MTLNSHLKLPEVSIANCQPPHSHTFRRLSRKQPRLYFTLYFYNLLTTMRLTATLSVLAVSLIVTTTTIAQDPHPPQLLHPAPKGPMDAHGPKGPMDPAAAFPMKPHFMDNFPSHPPGMLHHPPHPDHPSGHEKHPGHPIDHHAHSLDHGMHRALGHGHELLRHSKHELSSILHSSPEHPSHPEHSPHSEHSIHSSHPEHPIHTNPHHSDTFPIRPHFSTPPSLPKTIPATHPHPTPKSIHPQPAASILSKCGAGMCNSASHCCNAQCVDLMSDPTNCGFCGNVCPGNIQCLKGKCAFNGGLPRPDPVCTGCVPNSLCCYVGNTPTCVPNDEKNCGKCDLTCAAGVFCNNVMGTFKCGA